MKSLMLLCQSVLREIGTLCCTDTDLDFKTVEKRVDTEGLAFLTIRLADFSKDFERGLEIGTVSPTADVTLFQGFKRQSALPVFLGGVMGQVFNSETGVLLDSPNVEAIRCLRQFTLMWAKIELDCTEERILAAKQEYLKCEREVGVTTSNLEKDYYLRPSIDDSDESLISRFIRVSQLLWCDVLQKVEEDFVYDRVMPRHGPGSTADGKTGNSKFYQSEWPSRLELYFRSSEYLTPSPRFYQEVGDRVTYLEPGAERPVRVITVPKTQKTPRIIAIEPTCMQYTQQSLMEKLYEYVDHEGDSLGLNIVGFADQVPNQVLAREGSLHKELATLDLSEASDRVSNLLVKALLSRTPNLLGAVQACRSTRADVDGQIIDLAKFASMGSALTFPMEAMVFSTCVLIGYEEALNTRLTPKLVKELKGRVRVYGDDIIVPVDIVLQVMDTLKAYGFKVNQRKSFWNGYFRESCGKDYYAGEDVTVVRVRQDIPSSLEDRPEKLISVVSLRNQFYKAGYWSTAAFLDDMISELFRGHYPVVAETSPVLGRHSFLGYETQKMSVHTHAPIVRGYRVSSTSPVNSVDGIEALLKWFLKRGDEPIADRNHLVRSGRSQTSNIILRWGSPF
jgi:hypothetical protein